MTPLTISLRDEDQQFIEDALNTGRYLTESEVVSDAIAELRSREEVRKAKLSDFQAEVRIGLDQLDRGEGAEWNVEELKTKGRELLAARKVAS